MRRAKLGTLIIAILQIAVAATVGGQAVGTHLDFDLTAAEEEAYWYSRYNLGHLTMRSGMGEVFIPDPEMVEMMVALADADPNDGDTVSPPVNPALLRTVFAGGDPHWIQTADPADFATLRWDPESFDTRVTGSALGWTLVKEIEWAKQFHIDAHFGTSEDEYGAQWRFMGLVLMAMAKEQALAWMELQDAGEMVTLDNAGPFIMLMAISDLAQVLDAETMPRSATNRYRDPEGAAIFRGVADEQFDRVIGIPVEGMSVKELATAIEGLVWYAAVTESGARQALALEQLDELGTLLIEMPAESAAEIGYALRGLIEVHRTTGLVVSLHATLDLLETLALDYDEEFGLFASQTTYTIDDVAAIVGGLNAMRLYGDADVRLVEEILTGFFESAVNQSGLQQSVPPIASGKGDFEQGDPEIFYGYPGIPLPDEVGEFGVAPVFASSVTFDFEAGEWAGIDRRFETAGAMHAASEFIWLHTDEVNGFPIVEPIAMASVEPVEPVEPVDDTVCPVGLGIGVLFFLAALAFGLFGGFGMFDTCK